MAKEATYKKDPYTGAVIFTNVDAYAQRKRVMEQHRLSEKAKKDSKRSINSMKNEIKSLKKLVSDFIEGGKN